MFSLPENMGSTNSSVTKSSLSGSISGECRRKGEVLSAIFGQGPVLSLRALLLSYTQLLGRHRSADWSMAKV
jgi:hypothetical protein